MTQRLTVRLDDEIGDRVEAEADRRDRSMAYIVAECVEQCLGDTADVAPTQRESDRIAALEATVDELAERLDALEGDASLNQQSETSDAEMLVKTDADEPDAEAETPTPGGSKRGLHDPDAAVKWAVANQPASRREIVAACYDKSVATVNSGTWWENRVRPRLKDRGLVFVRNRGWVITETETESESESESEDD